MQASIQIRTSQFAFLLVPNVANIPYLPYCNLHVKAGTQSTFPAFIIAVFTHSNLSLACFVEHQMPHLASMFT